jgi:hypothetical protein
MNWFCRLFGHWFRRGRVIQGSDVVADYELCRVCGLYKEKPTR